MLTQLKMSFCGDFNCIQYHLIYNFTLNAVTSQFIQFICMCLISYIPIFVCQNNVYNRLLIYINDILSLGHDFREICVFRVVSRAFGARPFLSFMIPLTWTQWILLGVLLSYHYYCYMYLCFNELLGFKVLHYYVL